jgi:glycerate 2-kinase
MEQRPFSDAPTIVPADARELLQGLFRAMVDAAAPERLLPSRLPPPPRGRTLVLGAGKAAAAMARAVEDHWHGPVSGLVVTRYGHGIPCRRVEIVEAGHPFPDSVGLRTAERMLELTRDLSSDDLVLALFSGGGSALLTLPAPGLTLAELQEANRQLLRSGVPIAQVNCVRKHLSAIAGGRLGAACAPAPVVTFLISDVPGDDPTVIASGPTVADPTTFAEARALVERHHLDLPPAVRRHLELARDETPKPGDPRLSRGDVIVLATPGQALEAAAAKARAAGLTPTVLGADLQGEARDVAATHADLVRAAHRSRSGRDRGSPAPAPTLILSGGETTVTVRGGGKGGRNTEYLLALALALRAEKGETARVFALAADTDGIDGTEENAGAFLYPDTLERTAAAGLDPQAFLDDNDSHGLFERLGDLLVTGPTRTNVNDFRAILPV